MKAPENQRLITYLLVLLRADYLDIFVKKWKGKSIWRISIYSKWKYNCYRCLSESNRILC
jgi:hypothetical protein